MLSELGGPGQLENARQAVTHLAGSSARLELAKARFALAQALRAAEDLTGARDQLEQAASLAQDCGAVILAQRAAEAATGSRTVTRA
jgi:hypothetical protein